MSVGCIPRLAASGERNHYISNLEEDRRVGSRQIDREGESFYFRSSRRPWRQACRRAKEPPVVQFLLPSARLRRHRLRRQREVLVGDERRPGRSSAWLLHTRPRESSRACSLLQVAVEVAVECEATVGRRWCTPPLPARPLHRDEKECPECRCRWCSMVGYHRRYSTLGRPVDDDENLARIERIVDEVRRRAGVLPSRRSADAEAWRHSRDRNRSSSWERDLV